MGKAIGIFTLKAQFIPLGNIFGVDEIHPEEQLDSFISFDLDKGGIFSVRLLTNLKRRKTIA